MIWLTFKPYLLLPVNITIRFLGVFTDMNKKRGIKILTELLDLKDVKVVSQRLHAGIGILLQTESIRSYSICPRCGTSSHKLHQNHRHIVKDLPFGDKPRLLTLMVF